MGKADLHIHTTASDGLLDPRDVIEYAASETDLSVVAIADHDTLEGAHEAWNWLQAHPTAIGFVWGVEMTAAWFRHLLFFWPEQPPRRLPRRFLPPARLIAEMRRTGATWVAPHPTNPVSLTGPELRALAAQGLAPTAVEACNPALGRRKEPCVRGLGRELGLGIIGGSDTHGMLATIGAAYTRFPGTSCRQLLAALRERTCDGAWATVQVRTPAAILARQFLRAWVLKPGLLQHMR